MDRYLFLDFDGVLNTGIYAKQMALEVQVRIINT